GGRRAGGDIRYFTGVVKLDTTAPGLKPGMSTRVDIALSPQENVLVIPHEAVRSDRRKKVCFVARDESLERREVTIGEQSTNVVQIVNGLEEGELVALDPPVQGGHVEPLFNFDEIDDAPSADSNTMVATQH